MLYILHGPDDFTQSEKIKQIKAKLGVSDPTTADLNITHLEDRNLTLGEIRNQSDTMPFLAAKRLVIVKGFLSSLKTKSKTTQALVDYVSHLPASTDLIFVEASKLDKRHPVLKAVRQAGGEILFTDLNEKSLRPWIEKRVKELNNRIEPSAIELLIKRVGLNLHLLNNEIEKLTLYVNQQHPIRRAEIELLVPYAEEADKFGLSNAIGLRNAAKAYDQLRKELDEGKNPMAILGSIAAQIRTLIEVKDMAERGFSPPEIAKAKGWRSSYAAKIRLKEATNFSMTRLEQIMEMLLEIDLAIKTGRIDSTLALDTLIARLCAGGTSKP